MDTCGHGGRERGGGFYKIARTRILYTPPYINPQKNFDIIVPHFDSCTRTFFRRYSSILFEILGDSLTPVHHVVKKKKSDAFIVKTKKTVSRLFFATKKKVHQHIVVQVGERM